MRGNQRSCRCRGARLRNSTDTFQICTSLSASPESPRAISSAMIAKVCVSVPLSSSSPPNSSGTPSVRSPTLSAPARISRGSRSAGVISHSRCQLPRMNGITTSSTKSRHDCRIRRCSSDSPWLDAMSSMGSHLWSMVRRLGRVLETQPFGVFVQRMLGLAKGSTQPTTLRRLPRRQERAHAVERLEDVLGRVGVGEPHIALA